MRLIIFLSLILSFFLITSSELQAASKEKDVTSELKEKGLTNYILKPLNQSCKEAVNFDFGEDHRFWNGIWNKKKKGSMVIIDFLQGTKHFSLTMLPLKDGTCQTSRTITSYWTTPCKELSSKYKEQFSEKSIDVKETQDIFMWISSGKGTDIFLYDTPGGCVEVFREFYVRGKSEK